MDALSKILLKIRTPILLAAFAVFILYLLKDTFVEVLEIGNSEAFGQFLGFLLILLVLIVGMSFLFGISKKEMETDVATTGSKSVVKKGKRTEIDQSGKGHDSVVEDSEDTIVRQNDGASDKKKAR